MNKLTVLAMLGFLVSCHTTESLSTGESATTPNSSSKETSATTDTIPKLNRKQQAAKDAQNAGNIQLQPASGTGDLTNPKASKKVTRN